MRGERKKLIGILFSIFIIVSQACANEEWIIPQEIFQGDLKTISIKSTDLVLAYFEEEPVVLWKENGKWRGIIGSDLFSPVGKKRLTLKSGMTEKVFLVEVKKRELPIRYLTLPEKWLKLPKEVLERIQMEKERLRCLFGEKWETPPLWKESFRWPVKGRISDGFGTKRLINGQYVSYHLGIDLSAPKGEKVYPSNRGEVVFAGPLVLEGNTVIIHHGIGLYSLYCHLEEIRVREGEFVKEDFPIGTIGSTGRAQGPHLHFSVIFRNKKVDPLSLLEALGYEDGRKVF